MANGNYSPPVNHRARRQHCGGRSSLIVCASLVENPMNLGALCRTVEVFGLESLVLSRLVISQTREFIKLAVSAHH